MNNPFETMTEKELSRLRDFLSQVRYMDVYHYVPSRGDGNRKNSLSDIQTRETLAVIQKVLAAIPAK